MRWFVGILAGLATFAVFAQNAPAKPHVLRLVAASTAAETGMITFLAQGFEAQHPGVAVEVEYAGALAVLDRARGGYADAVITHYPESELIFVEEGYGLLRTLLMYNEFAIFGPPNDPLRLRRESDIRAVLRKLAEEQVSFMVPGRRSGTFKKLDELWVLTGITPDWPGYEVTDASSASTLRTASLFDAYTFADLGTYLVYRSELSDKLVPLVRDHVALRNYYTITVVNGEKVPGVNQKLAETFLEYLISDEAQERIRAYGEDRFGTSVFTPAAHLDASLRARRAVAAYEVQSANLRRAVMMLVVLTVVSLIAGALFSRTRMLERATRRSEERYALAIAGANDGIWDWDLRSDRIYFSPRLQEILRFQTKDNVAQSPHAILAERLHAEERDQILASIGQYLEGDGRELLEVEGRWRSDGDEYRWVLIRGKALRDASGKPIRMSGSITDITQRRAQEEALLHQALHDSLTGLPNRTLFVDRIQQGIRVASRARRSMAVIVLGLDRFKDVNDTLGYDVGDLLLKEVAARLDRVLRSSDTVARLGGDEFAVLLPDVAGELYANHVAKKISLVLSRPMDLEQHTLHIAAGVGIALYPQHGEDADTLIRHADIAMNAAKRSGSGCALYQPEQHRGSVRRMALANDLHEALERDALSLHFQPQIDLRTGAPVGFEALLRWQHPKQGWIPPDEVIPIAEQTGLIRPLTLWVLDAALQQQAEWKNLGVQLRVSVNLSVWSLQDPKLAEEIAESLERWNCPSPSLELEITESGMMADPRRSLEILTQLHRMGIGLAIDDYGTGFSSLAYLKRLPVDVIKIDKSFVMAMDRDEDDAVIVRSTIDLAHNLGLKVVAEGVESKQIADKLAEFGCDFTQGYYYCRPCSGEACLRWLSESPWGGSKSSNASIN